jgi:hypothetical protein
VVFELRFAALAPELSDRQARGAMAGQKDVAGAFQQNDLLGHMFIGPVHFVYCDVGRQECDDVAFIDDTRQWDLRQLTDTLRRHEAWLPEGHHPHDRVAVIDEIDAKHGGNGAAQGMAGNVCRVALLQEGTETTMTA